MPTMNIKDPEVRRLASELAARRGTSMTDAVRQALSEALERQARRSERIYAAIIEISDRCSRIDDPILTDADLYDDDGLPRTDRP